MAYPFFALTFRGLEAVSAQEMAQLDGVTVGQIGYRRVGGTGESLAGLLGLRTVDDVFLHTADWSPIERQRAMLQRFTELSQQLDLRPLVAACATIRAISAAPVFSVTASFVGKRNYTSDEIKQAVSAGIAQRHGWRYSGDDSLADFNVRLFIEHERAVVGLRLGRRPLHERAYKLAGRSGSLKPPIAAAMLRLAEVSAGQTLVDPCAGAGTILLEAAAVGARAFGGDLDPAALAAARLNGCWLAQWDARRLPVASASVGRVVTNLPWGRQVAADSAFYQAACREMRRITTPGGRIAVLTSTPEWVVFPDLDCTGQVEISLFGQTPSILVFSA